jgi:hypothetical protein
MWPDVDHFEMVKINNIDRLNKETDMDDLFVSHLKTLFQFKSLYRSSVECKEKLSGVVRYGHGRIRQCHSLEDTTLELACRK